MPQIAVNIDVCLLVEREASLQSDVSSEPAFPSKQQALVTGYGVYTSQKGQLCLEPVAEQ